MAKGGGPSLLTLLLIGGGGYLAYQYFFASTSAAQASAMPTPAGPPHVTPPTAAMVASAASSTALDTQFNNMVTAATNQTPPFASGSPDQWGFYYAQGNPGMTAPTPESAGWNRQTNYPTNLSAAQYWAAVVPLISKAQGLSGLGAYGTIAMLAHRRAR